jgi:hypothetical protein
MNLTFGGWGWEAMDYVVALSLEWYGSKGLWHSPEFANCLNIFKK